MAPAKGKSFSDHLSSLSGRKKSKKGDASISETIKLLKARGFEVHTDGTAVRPWYLVDPRTSKHIAKWDSLLALAISATALITPYEIAFLPEDDDKYFWLTVANWIILAIFAVGIVAAFSRRKSTPNRISFESLSGSVA